MAAELLSVVLVARAAWVWRHAGPALPMAAGVLGSVLVARYLNTEDYIVLLAATWLVFASQVGLGLKLAAGAAFAGAELYGLSLALPLGAAGVALLALAAGPRFKLSVEPVARLALRTRRAAL